MCAGRHAGPHLMAHPASGHAARLWARPGVSAAEGSFRHQLTRATRAQPKRSPGGKTRPCSRQLLPAPGSLPKMRRRLRQSSPKQCPCHMPHSPPGRSQQLLVQNKSSPKQTMCPGQLQMRPGHSLRLRCSPLLRHLRPRRQLLPSARQLGLFLYYQRQHQHSQLDAQMLTRPQLLLLLRPQHASAMPGPHFLAQPLSRKLSLCQQPRSHTVQQARSHHSPVGSLPYLQPPSQLL